MGFSNSSLITNTQENKTLKDQIERERYEHRRALMNQEDKTFLEVIKPLEDEVESLQEQLEYNIYMKEKHDNLTDEYLELEEQVELLKEVKEIYGEENNNWEDDDFFLDACRERESVFEKYHEGTLVEQEELEFSRCANKKAVLKNKELKDENKKLKAKADCFTALVYGIGWETLHELCDDTTTARLIESGEFVPEDFA